MSIPSNLEKALDNLGNEPDSNNNIIVSTYPPKSGTTTAIASTIKKLLTNTHPSIKPTKSYTIWLISTSYQLFRDYFEKLMNCLDNEGLTATYNKDGILEYVNHNKTENELYCFTFDLPLLQNLKVPDIIFIDKIEDSDGNFLTAESMKAILYKCKEAQDNKQLFKMFIALSTIKKAEWAESIIEQIKPKFSTENPYLQSQK